MVVRNGLTAMVELANGAAGRERHRVEACRRGRTSSKVLDDI